MRLQLIVQILATLSIAGAITILEREVCAEDCDYSGSFWDAFQTLLLVLRLLERHLLR